MIVQTEELTQWGIELYDSEEVIVISADLIDITDNGQLHFLTNTVNKGHCLNAVFAHGSWRNVSRVT